MNDDDIDHDEPDRGDEHVAALLEVPPLDDLTRRRLVRRALAEAGPAAPTRGTRFLRVAAVVVGVAVVGGVAALVLRDGGGTGRETADRSAAPTEATTDEAFGAAPGDLGEISDPDVLRERLAVTQAPPATDADGPESFEEPQADTAVDTLAPACLSTLQSNGAEPVLLVSTGTYRGAPAIVVVAGAAGDAAFVLDQATCALLTTVPLA